MPDRKTVMKWLDLCSHPEVCCGKDGGCPYWIDVDESAAYEPQVEHCMDGLLRDALTLLREQEPVKPEFDSLDGNVGRWRCGSCRISLGAVRPPYCWHCGRKVKWDDA